MRTIAVVLFGLLCCFGCAACEECRNCRNCGECRDGRNDVKRGVEDHGDDSGIRIESARYGRDDVWVDVTSQVRGLVSGDTLVFPRDLHKTLNVDPMPNR